MCGWFNQEDHTTGPLVSKYVESGSWQQVSTEDVREKLTVQCYFQLLCRFARFGGCGSGRKREYNADGAAGRRVRQHPGHGGRVLQGSAAAPHGVPAEQQNRHQQEGDHHQVQVRLGHVEVPIRRPLSVERKGALPLSIAQAQAA